MLRFLSRINNQKMVALFFLAVVIWIVYKFYRFWTHKDDTIFNKKILDINSTYEPGTILPPYPNLWYPVIQSRNLKRGQVKPLYVLEKNLVVFRTVSGKVHILDAFCPHLGAHLGVGGSVIGEDIRCPFHSWTFNGQGVCTFAPGLKGLNIPKARVKSWRCIEINGWVYVWHHNKDQEPNWKPMIFEELKDSRHSGEAQDIQHGHLVDILSNTADLGHFEGIHSLSGIISPWQVLRKGKIYYFIYKLFHLDYQATWTHGRGLDSHIACMQVKATPILLGLPLTMLQTITKAKICPPVYCIENKMTMFDKIRFYLVSVLTPISPMKHIFTHNVYHPPGLLSKLFARIGFYSVVPSTGPDKIIYNNKKFLNNPYFTSLDKEQVTFFKWFKKNFYSFQKFKPSTI